RCTDRRERRHRCRDGRERRRRPARRAGRGGRRRLATPRAALDLPLVRFAGPSAGVPLLPELLPLRGRSRRRARPGAGRVAGAAAAAALPPLGRGRPGSGTAAGRRIRPSRTSSLMKDTNQRLFLTVALCFAVALVWSYFFQPKPPPRVPAQPPAAVKQEPPPGATAQPSGGATS